MKIIQERIKNCDDSFFYNGTIATKEARGGEYVLQAIGEIKIKRYDKNDNVIGEYTGWKNRGDFGLDIETDKDLDNIDDREYVWENNNWFEIWWEDEKGDSEEFGIFYSYDEAIKELKKLS
jgi:hypothetical protein